MGYNFAVAEQDQLFWLPPDARDWLPRRSLGTTDSLKWHMEGFDGFRRGQEHHAAGSPLSRHPAGDVPAGCRDSRYGMILR
jgi:hypothetical protein